MQSALGIMQFTLKNALLVKNRNAKCIETNALCIGKCIMHNAVCIQKCIIRMHFCDLQCTFEVKVHYSNAKCIGYKGYNALSLQKCIIDHKTALCIMHFPVQSALVSMHFAF